MLFNSKSNREVLAELDKRVYGHTEAKKALITLVNRSILRHFQKFLDLRMDEELIPTGRCLLIGGSGTGKTFLVDTIANLLGLPLVKLDATKLTVTGAGGGIKSDDVEDVIYQNARRLTKEWPELYYSVEGTVAKTIVFVDEVDKLANKFDSSRSWNDQVQANFLTVFENTNTLADVSWIFAGAFSKMEKVRKTNAIGFNGVATTEENNIDDDIIKFGLLPELVGRMSSIVELDIFTAKDFVKIFEEVLLPKKEEHLRMFGADFPSFTDSGILRMCEQAEKSGQGVRYLQRQLDKVCADLEFDYEDSEANNGGRTRLLSIQD